MIKAKEIESKIQKLQNKFNEHTQIFRVFTLVIKKLFEKNWVENIQIWEWLGIHRKKAFLIYCEKTIT